MRCEGEKGKEWKGRRVLPSYVKTGETHLSSFQVNRMRTPITLAHLGRRSTYFRQIGRNGVGFSIDRTGTLTTDDEILPGGFSSSLDPAPPTRTPRSFDRTGSFIYRLHKWNMLRERLRYIRSIDFSSRILIEWMKKRNNVFFLIEFEVSFMRRNYLNISLGLYIFFLSMSQLKTKTTP